MSKASDAQARLLAALADHRDEDIVVSQERSYVAAYVERDDHGRLFGVQHFVHIDEKYPALLPISRGVRLSTFHACERRGWLRRSREIDVTTQHIGVSWTTEPKTYTMLAVEITDLGLIALGLWRQNPRVEETPRLEGEDRDLVALAHECNRRGFAMVPVTKPAKKEARRLAKGMFAKRGWGGGASTLALEPSAAGEVEVGDPDKPEVGSMWDILARSEGLRSAVE